MKEEDAQKSLQNLVETYNKEYGASNPLDYDKVNTLSQNGQANELANYIDNNVTRRADANNILEASSRLMEAKGIEIPDPAIALSEKILQELVDASDKSSEIVKSIKDHNLLDQDGKVRVNDKNALGELSTDVFSAGEINKSLVIGYIAAEQDKDNYKDLINEINENRAKDNQLAIPPGKDSSKADQMRYNTIEDPSKSNWQKVEVSKSKKKKKIKIKGFGSKKKKENHDLSKSDWKSADVDKSKEKNDSKIELIGSRGKQENQVESVEKTGLKELKKAIDGMAAAREFEIKDKGVSDTSSLMMYHRDFGKGSKTLEKLEKYAIEGNVAKLVKSVDGLVEAHGKSVESHADEILNAAGKLMKENGKYKDSDIVLAENIANNLCSEVRKEKRQERGKEQNAKLDSNSDKFIFKEYLNDKGKVEFKNKEQIQELGKKIEKNFTNSAISENKVNALRLIQSIDSGRSDYEKNNINGQIDFYKEGQQNRLNSINAHSMAANSKFKKFTLPPEKGSSYSDELRYQASITPEPKKGVSAAYSKVSKIVENIRNKLTKQGSSKAKSRPVPNKVVKNQSQNQGRG